MEPKVKMMDICRSAGWLDHETIMDLRDEGGRGIRWSLKRKGGGKIGP